MEDEQEHVHPYYEDVARFCHSCSIFSNSLDHGDVHESFFLFKSKKRKIKVFLQVLWKMFMMQIMARPFSKTPGFGCTVNFDFTSWYLQCLVDDFSMQGICI